MFTSKSLSNTFNRIIEERKEKKGMKTRAQLIKEIMAEFEKDGEPVTEEEAGEIADLEIKAKKNNVKHYERSTKPRNKPTRERKIDTEKLEILEELQAALELCGITATREREVALHFGDYELKLIRHKKVVDKQ